MDNIQLTGPQPLLIQPQDVVTILEALNELPYKQAKPLIDDIMSQLREHQLRLASLVQLRQHEGTGQAPESGNAGSAN